jgi:hypothetical protein
MKCGDAVGSFFAHQEQREFSIISEQMSIISTFFFNFCEMRDDKHKQTLLTTCEVISNHGQDFA